MTEDLKTSKSGLRLNRRAAIAIASGLIVLVAMLLFFDSGDIEVRKRIKAGAKLLEKGTVEEIADFVARDYSGEIAADKEQLMAIVEAFLDRTRHRRVKLLDIKIEMREKSAEAICQFEMRGYVGLYSYEVPLERFRRDREKSYEEARMQWVLRDGKWRCTQLEIVDFTTPDPEEMFPRRQHSSGTTGQRNVAQ